MPNYVYQSLVDPDKRFDLSHSLHDKALEAHPETGEAICRIIVPGATIRRTGLKKSTRVNKKSPAATACGCASTSALESLGMAKTTPRYNANSTAAHSHGHGHSHAHSHGGQPCTSSHKK